MARTTYEKTCSSGVLICSSRIHQYSDVLESGDSIHKQEQVAVNGGEELMRLEARFTGRVQGVGFRYTAHRIAQHHCVVGFVRNLPDGSVQVVVEGVGADAFLDELKAAMGSKVQGERRVEGNATGEFASFEIRY